MSFQLNIAIAPVPVLHPVTKMPIYVIQDKAECEATLDRLKLMLTKDVEKLTEDDAAKKELVGRMVHSHRLLHRRFHADLSWQGSLTVYAKTLRYKRSTFEVWMGKPLYAVWDEIGRQVNKLPDGKQVLDLDTSFLFNITFTDHRETLVRQVAALNKIIGDQPPAVIDDVGMLDPNVR